MSDPIIPTRGQLELDLSEIQGLVIRGHGKLPFARFFILAVTERAAARAYLRDLAPRVNIARDSPMHGCALHVALSAKGLVALGVPARARSTFSREFLEDMDDDVRAVALGDRGTNAAASWWWGQRAEPVHALLMVYAESAPGLEEHARAELGKLAGGFTVLHAQDTITLIDQKEHFGWRDGLSNPNIEGVPAERHNQTRHPQQFWTDPIRPGEFVLGYMNEYDNFSETPIAQPEEDPQNILPVIDDPARADVGKKDLGKNGTYLVYRDMSQDVPALWTYLSEQSREPGDDATARAVGLGAKMVGRWLDGAPLSTSPTHDDPARRRDNKFLYEDDEAGLKCPVGAHIRRATPRDRLAVDRGLDESLQMVRRHQMLRRGRSFGRPVADNMKPADILAARDTPRAAEPRGLHFIALVGHISRQFEFVQRAWMQSAVFGGQFKDGDAITGARRPFGDEDQPEFADERGLVNDEFTCPASPLRRKYKAMPQFTTIVGGGYFFLPGITALKYLASEFPE